MNGKEEGSTSAPESPGSRSRGNGSAARTLPHNNGKIKTIMCRIRILQNILSIWTVLWDNEKKNAHKNIFYHREEDTDL